MKSFLALALTAYVSTLVAQDKPAAAATQWTQLREAFAEAQAGEYAAVIAVVDGGEPLILTVGSDSSGKDLAPQTLVPLLALAKVLAADAVHVQLKGNLEQAVGGKLGERAPTVRELLHGLPALPDFFVLDGGQELADIDLLQKCGTAAAVANVEPQASRLGASEFVLLEPMVLGERHKNWSAMVRTTLSPHIGGLDPVSADAVVGQQRSMLPTAEDLAKLATAQPALLRTMLSLKDLGTWMQWRVRQDAPLWASARMGAMVASRRMPGVQYWVMGGKSLGADVLLAQYPAHKAALLRIVPQRNPKLMQQLQVAFEEDLGAIAPEQGTSQAERMQAMRAGAVAAHKAQGSSATSALGGTRWSAAAVGGKGEALLAFGANLKDRVVLTLDGEPLSFAMTPSGAGLRSVPWRRGTEMLSLWVVPEPDAAKPTKVTCVLLKGRVSEGHSAAFTTTACVPHYFELFPAKD